MKYEKETDPWLIAVQDLAYEIYTNFDITPKESFEQAKAFYDEWEAFKKDSAIYKYDIEPDCEYCKKPMFTRIKVVNGKGYHPGCPELQKCSVCELMITRDQPAVQNGQISHKNCVTNCTKCTGPLDKDYVIVDKSSYHSGCTPHLKCNICGIAGGDKYYIVEHKRVHRKCHDLRNSM